MKKLIAILVVFALVMGAAFAEASVSGAVFSTVDLINGTTASDSAGDAMKPTAGISMNRIRIEAQGQDDDGVFGAWVRAEGGGFAGNAWWKPIDQFLMRMGSNGGDGFWGKEGVTGWGFYQTVSDVGVAFGGENVWGWGIQKDFLGLGDYAVGRSGAPGFGTGIKFRDAFFGGIGDNALMLEIKPVDMFGINIGLVGGGLAEDYYPNAIIQLDLNLDFGNIAVTFASGRGYVEGEKGTKVPGDQSKMPYEIVQPDADLDDYVAGATYGSVSQKLAGEATVGATDDIIDPAKVFLYGGLNLADNISLDLGVGIAFPYKVSDKVTINEPVAIGAGLKFGITDEFTLKFRAVAAVAGNIDNDGDKVNMPTVILADVLPSYAINDKITVFCSIGLAIALMPTDEDSEKAWLTNDDGDPLNNVGFHINPYIQVGSEWGPKFLAGIKVWSLGEADTGYGKKGDEKAPIYFSVPIAIQASF